MTSLGDVYAYCLSAGRRLGVAEARAALRGKDHPDVQRAYADTLAFANEVAGIDPVAGQAIREAVYASMHGDDVIEGSVSTPELGAG